MIRSPPAKSLQPFVPRLNEGKYERLPTGNE